MSRAIWKYPLEVVDRQEVMMPTGARPLCVQVQHGVPCVWALVDAFADPDEVEPVVFATYGTGHPMPRDPGTYFGTYQMSFGALVFHVFLPSGSSPEIAISPEG